MNKEWFETTIGEQVTLQRGFDITREEQKPGKVPVVSSSGISSYHNESQVAGPGVILGRKGVVGSVFYIEPDYWPHDTTLWVKDFHGNNPRFVYYFFKDLAPVLAKMDVGSANPTLNRNHVHPMKIKWPSISVQRTIANILGSLDDKIELNRQMSETLEAMARAIFKSWFVDFDPVRAKAEGRQPVGMDAETVALIPSEFEVINGQNIPKGWRTVRLSEIINLHGGGTPKTTIQEYWNGDIPWFSVVDAPGESDIFVIDTEKHITQEGVNNCSASILPVGTTIITARGTVGKLALVGVPMAINQSCYGIRGKIGYPDFFIYFLMKKIVDDLKHQTHGTVFETITRQTFSGVNVTIPPVTIARQFDALIHPYLMKIINNLFQIKSLADLRDILLPKLISGEIRVNALSEENAAMG
ncbi:MAG: restriction endonuclease subunit S [Methanomicrobiales archaeon]|nr:restriction endonuclease subunit S [Methanomicrobiales archaeon]MDI6877673.1 restriction endonuclease subunit S [Methanomicrobiales archaeon]